MSAGQSVLLEALAAACHDSWSHWMRWQLSIATRHADGSVTLDAASVARWTRQMDTPYAALSEREKASDRREAETMLAVCPQTCGRCGHVMP